MSAAKNPIVVFDEDRMSNNADDSRRPSRLVPAWIISCCVNTAVLAAFFLLSAPDAETAAVDSSFLTMPETTVTPPTLDVEEMGTGDREINYDIDRIADVSIFGPNNPMDPVGAPGDSAILESLPPPPGTGQGAGAAPKGPRPGLGSDLGPIGGQHGHLLTAGNMGHRLTGGTRRRALIEGGGTAASQAAVARGCRWIVEHQSNAGYWSLRRFREHGRCNCTGGGATDSDVAATAFGLLPLLGKGETHKPGSDASQLYTKNVERGLRWLVQKQNRDGSFEPNSHHEMYSHGLATIALCEAYALTSDPALRRPCQSALNYICQAQSPEGGWRYNARNAKGYDGSIGAWELMALKSGQMAGLDVPVATLQRSTKWLDAASSPDGSRYGYTSPHAANGLRPATTSAGLLCRMYLGWSPRSPGLIKGAQYLRAHKPRVNDMYYSYYATQVMHHLGGAYWDEWNPVMRDSLIDAQDKGDKVAHQRGSWYDSSDRIASGRGGRLMQTSLSLVTLEVYYRHLPLYRREVGASKDVAGK